MLPRVLFGWRGMLGFLAVNSCPLSSHLFWDTIISVAYLRSAEMVLLVGFYCFLIEGNEKKKLS